MSFSLARRKRRVFKRDFVKERRPFRHFHRMALLSSQRSLASAHPRHQYCLRVRHPPVVIAVPALPEVATGLARAALAAALVSAQVALMLAAEVCC